jgi:hypothetical protein
MGDTLFFFKKSLKRMHSGPIIHSTHPPCLCPEEMGMTKYLKTALTHKQHIEQWEERGLIVSDYEKASHYLSAINYYRLSAYT